MTTPNDVTPEQITSIMDKADATMAMFLKKQCDHRWKVTAREEVRSFYSPIDMDEPWLELDDSVTLKVLEIESATCAKCGADASDTEVAALKHQLPG